MKKFSIFLEEQKVVKADEPEMPLEGWRNKGGTGERKCGCGSWKKHWMNLSKEEWPKYCSESLCLEKPKDGAHIYHPDVEGEYIVPLCAKHNHPENTDEFDLADDTIFVSANQQKSCKND